MIGGRKKERERERAQREDGGDDSDGEDVTGNQLCPLHI